MYFFSYFELKNRNVAGKKIIQMTSSRSSKMIVKEETDEQHMETSTPFTTTLDMKPKVEVSEHVCFTYK